tara:strand:- start:255 stop:443 length:189 start_codon:yes stop_codon:yes gene_type:complete
MLADFSIGEMSIAIVSIIGACGGFLVILERSRCSSIKCCCIRLKREVPVLIEEENIEKINKV